MKKTLPIIMIVVGALGLLLAVAVLLMGLYGTFNSPSPSVGIIGGAGGPTLRLLLQTWFLEWQLVIYVGIILIVVGVVLLNKRAKF